MDPGKSGEKSEEEAMDHLRALKKLKWCKREKLSKREVISVSCFPFATCSLNCRGASNPHTGKLELGTRCLGDVGRQVADRSSNSPLVFT